MSNTKVFNFVITAAFLSATMLNPAVIYNRDARMISSAWAGVANPAPKASKKDKATKAAKVLATTAAPVAAVAAAASPAVTAPLAAALSTQFSTAADPVRQKCSDLQEKVTKVGSEYKTACQQVMKVQPSGKGSSDQAIAVACNKKLSDCASQESEEQDISASDIFQSGATASGDPAAALFSDMISNDTDDKISCPHYTASSFKDAKEAIQRELDKAKKDLEEKTKALSTMQKEATEKSAKLQTEMIDAKKNYEKKAHDDKEQERNERASIKEQRDKLNASIRETQMQLLSTQAARAAAVGDRNIKIEGYKLELIGCRSTALQKQAENRKNQNTVSSLATANTRGSGSASDVKTIWTTCVNAVLKRRTSESENYRLQMQTLDLKYSHLDLEMRDKQQSLILLNQQEASANKDRLQMKQQEAIDYNQSLAVMNNQQMQMEAQFRQDMNNLSVEIAKAEAEVNSKSNELRDVNKQKPGADTKYTQSDVTAKMTEYLDSSRDFAKLCGGQADFKEAADSASKAVESIEGGSK